MGRPASCSNAVTSVRLLRRNKSHGSGIGLPEGAIKGMQTSTANYIQQSTAAVVATSEAPTTDDANVVTGENHDDALAPDTFNSQRDVIIGETRVGTAKGGGDLPMQLGQWLQSFRGTEVAVTANGQCAFFAMFATTINHAGPEMKNTGPVVREVTDIKWFVYSLMMANLRKDVEARLVDPILECSRLYPKQPKYTNAEGATAALYAHYDTARKRSAAKHVPASFWAGPHELRAMAQYLREPILVFDVHADAEAHMQRYFYAKHRLADGTDHESGYVTPVSDRDAREYLRMCWRLHTFVVLKHTERHFYGVSHGNIFLRWRAEGDPGYMATIEEPLEWKSTLNDMTEYERSVDMGTVNQLEDSDNVNALMIKRCEMRVRLDLVHVRLGLPTLERAGIEADWDVILANEEEHIHAAYGLDSYAASSQTDNDEEATANKLPRRYARVATGDVTMTSYFRILRDSTDAPMATEDLPMSALVQAANFEAFVKWCTFYRGSFDTPETKRRTQIADIRPWLLTRPDALRHLFAFLPYPEHEAKAWSMESLEQWGAQEVFLEQTRAVSRIIQDPEMTLAVRDFCTKWLLDCTDATSSTPIAQERASSPIKWKQLSEWLTPEHCRAQPQDLTETQWRVLHVLPYIVGDCTDTLMARAPNGARWTWYRRFPFLKTLCHGIPNSSAYYGHHVQGTQVHTKFHVHLAT